MLDQWSLKIVAPMLRGSAEYLYDKGVKANQVTITGFFVGMSVLLLLSFELYYLAIAAIVFNRVCDGLDGAIARQAGASDAGAFLDIVLDFIFYAAVVFGFALANPEQNALAAAFLLFSFMGTGSSFLAFAILAQKRSIPNMQYPNKGFYYLGGLAEGTETIIFLVLICLFSQWFCYLAIGFGLVCWITTITRVVGGYYSLQLPLLDKDTSV